MNNILEVTKTFIQDLFKDYDRLWVINFTGCVRLQRAIPALKPEDTKYFEPRLEVLLITQNLLQ